MIRNKKNRQSGQTLLEALIALATAVVIISAMTVIVLSSLSNAQFSKNQNQATQYAQQGIEILKNQGQYNWNLILGYSTNNCMDGNNSIAQKPGSPPGCAQSPYIINSLFVREVNIQQSPSVPLNPLNTCNPYSNSALVTVSVGWSDNKCTSATDVYCHKVKLISCIYNSPSVSAP